MQTTIDLDPRLVERLRQRAIAEGRAVDELAADVLARGLERSHHNDHSEQRVEAPADADAGNGRSVPDQPGFHWHSQRMGEPLIKAESWGELMDKLLTADYLESIGDSKGSTRRTGQAESSTQ